MGDEESERKIKTKDIDVLQKDSEDMAKTFPDVCKTPSPGGPIPIPYPNIEKSSDTSKGTKNVKCDGKEVMLKDSSYTKSSGDEPSHVSEMEKVDTGKEAWVTFTRIMKARKLGVPVWIWSLIFVVALLAVWFLFPNTTPTVEPYDYPME